VLGEDGEEGGVSEYPNHPAVWTVLVGPLGVVGGIVWMVVWSNHDGKLSPVEWASFAWLAPLLVALFIDLRAHDRHMRAVDEYMRERGWQ
jgi:hypothetical protein